MYSSHNTFHVNISSRNSYRSAITPVLLWLQRLGPQNAAKVCRIEIRAIRREDSRELFCNWEALNVFHTIGWNCRTSTLNAQSVVFVHHDQPTKPVGEGCLVTRTIQDEVIKGQHIRNNSRARLLLCALDKAQRRTRRPSLLSWDMLWSPVLMAVLVVGAIGGLGGMLALVLCSEDQQVRVNVALTVFFEVIVGFVVLRVWVAGGMRRI